MAKTALARSNWALYRNVSATCPKLGQSGPQRVHTLTYKTWWWMKRRRLVSRVGNLLIGHRHVKITARAENSTRASRDVKLHTKFGANS